VGVATRLRGNHELRSRCSYPPWGTPTAPLLIVFGLTKMHIAGMDQGPVRRTRKGRRPFVKKRVLVTDGAGFFGSHLCALNAIIASLCHSSVDPSCALFVSSQTGVCCSSFQRPSRHVARAFSRHSAGQHWVRDAPQHRTSHLCTPVASTRGNSQRANRHGFSCERPGGGAEAYPSASQLD
jgi:hypothetical protein